MNFGARIPRTVAAPKMGVLRAHFVPWRPCAAVLVVLTGCNGERTRLEPTTFVPAPEATITLEVREAITSADIDQRATFLPGDDAAAGESLRLALNTDGHAQESVALRAGECLSAAAHLVSATVRGEVHLSLTDASTGARWIDDSDTQTAAIARWCTSHDQTLTLALTGPPREDVLIALHVETATPIDLQLWQDATQYFTPFRPQSPTHHFALAQGKRATFPFAVERDRCYAIVAAGGDGVEDLDLRLINLRGEQLLLEVATDARAFVGPYCPRHDEVVRAEFRMYAGEGEFGWRVLDIARDEGAAIAAQRLASPDGVKGWD